MSGVPTTQSPEPESPEPSPQGAESSPPRPLDETQPLPAEHKRSRQRKILTPLVLAAFGLVLLLVAIWFYPSATTGVSTPPYSILHISTNVPVATIDLYIVQESPALAEMRVELTSDTPVSNDKETTLGVAIPSGTSFKGCPAFTCPFSPGAPFWISGLVFKRACTLDGCVWAATANLFVNARSFGAAFNDVNATAAIPEVMYQGPGNPNMQVTYDIPAAASYDWSSFPTLTVSNSTATWQVNLVNGESPGRTAVGINAAGQASHDTRTFVAGALLGLAGGAILSAVQEALHASD
jgi:hypothetical protein